MFSKKGKPFLLSERGQMALFVALVFQVIFVLFSMVVNVGLLIHHKINLQNSVDLAAYYGAQKQAESLNALAHINYQIRQSWKLLSWRLRVAGFIGYYFYPLRSYGGYPRLEEDSKSFASPLPFTCIAHNIGWNFGEDNLCDATEKRIPDINYEDMRESVGIPLLGGGKAISTAKRALEEAIGAKSVLENQCFRVGRESWRTTALYFAAYRLEIAMRKEAIYLLAHNMSQGLPIGGGGVLDVEGGSVSEGMRKTLRKNLSLANRESLDLKIKQGRVGFGNSLNQEGCRGDMNRERPPLWLAEIKILPQAFYMESENCGIRGRESRYFIKPFREGPSKYIEPSIDNPLNSLVQEKKGLYGSSLGVEKNPWCMSYIGVYAETKPRIPFSPFGPVTLKARAFAKPFGGRVGPWFQSKWPRGYFSSGGKRTDPFLPPREGIEEEDIPSHWDELIPNYSRYVGDSAGLRSIFLLRHMATIFLKNKGGRTWKDWSQVLDGNFLTTNPKTRNLEIAAINPDIFDAYYYSIQPDFYKTYWESLHKKLLPLLGYKGSIPGVPFLPDLGASISVEDERFSPFSVKNQMEILDSIDSLGKSLFYLIKKKEHLLTSWTLDNLHTYEFPKRFGTCKLSPKEEGAPSVTGDCIAGGRSGYSVKMVSKSFLESPHLPLGGPGHEGSILNPPSSLEELFEVE